MKKTVLLLFCLSVVVSLIASGCSGQGLTAAERQRAHKRVLNSECKQIMDDIDRTILFHDRPDRKTIMYNR